MLSLNLEYKIIFLLWIYLSRCLTQTKPTNHNMASTIASRYLQPNDLLKTEYIKNRKYLEMTPPPVVIKAISDKMNELKAYFQDSIAVLDDQHEKEETTIIEFVPSEFSPKVMKTKNSEEEPLNKNIRKYQKLRDKIKVTLEKELVSSKAKNMVIQTIDDMITKMVSSQCNWNEKQKQILRLGQDKGECRFNNITLSREECRNIVLQYFAAVKVMNVSTERPEINFSNDFHKISDEMKHLFKELYRNQSLTFLNKFTETVADVMNDAQSLSDKYKVRCSLVEIDKAARRSSCDRFKLCTNEFREYLSDFYKYLNDTAVSAFRNYAAMYVRDVNSDASAEKVSVIQTINALSYIVERRVQEAFIKYTAKLKLTKSNEANIKCIKEYVKETSRYINKHVKKHLEDDLIKLKAKLILAIKQDININLDVDFGNLESTFLGRICTSFVTCNGEIGTQRKGFNSTNANTNLDPRSVYVKVEITLDEESMKDPKKNVNNFRRRNLNVKPTRTNKLMVTRTTFDTGNSTNMLFVNIINRK